MSNYSRLYLNLAFASLLMITAACAPPLHPPHPGKVIRNLHRYHYFPGAQIYYNPSNRVYFYSDGGIWLSAPILPPHIQIEINHYINIEIDGPKPYIHHRDHLRRYPPGLRKEKHRRQQEKWDAKREQKREKVEAHRERKEERKRDVQEHREEQRENAKALKKEKRQEIRVRPEKPRDERYEKKRNKDREDHIDKNRKRKNWDYDPDKGGWGWKKKNNDSWK